MILIDLYCKAGCGAVGYRRAGFKRIIGVDLEPQPNYPFEFVQADVEHVLARLVKGWPIMVDGVWLPARFITYAHASPPCQSFTDYRRKGHGVGDGYPNLIPMTRNYLRKLGIPYVIENVEKARGELIDPIRICGTNFPELDVQRHRLFESNVALEGTACDHRSRPPRFPGATNRAPLSRRTVEVGVYRIPLETQKRAMGVEHDVTLQELSEGIPPAYTEHIGRQLLGRNAGRLNLEAFVS
jgi:DNA (cytosine-5)-methyltransferase 1